MLSVRLDLIQILTSIGSNMVSCNNNLAFNTTIYIYVCIYFISNNDNRQYYFKSWSQVTHRKRPLFLPTLNN